MIIRTEESPSAEKFFAEPECADPIESIAEVLERTSKRVTDALES